MKKALSLMLALVMCLSLCACGNSGGSSDEVTLTMENYSKYLSIDAAVFTPSSSDAAVNLPNPAKFGDVITSTVYKYFNLRLNVEGVSTNFNYHDVSVTVRFFGKYQIYNRTAESYSIGNTLLAELTAECNIAGDGSSLTEFYPDHGFVFERQPNVDWEIVAVSGSITPAV